MINVVRAFDRSVITGLNADTRQSLERKLNTARDRFAHRAGWLPAYRRIQILNTLAALMSAQSEELAQLIASEGGKPYTDAVVETLRAIDGVRNAADTLLSRGGQEIPMGLTPTTIGRRAFTIKEPVGVVAAISAFNHPLNLVVHQVIPAVAVGCPVIIKPATVTPLSCLKLVSLLHEAGLPEGWVQTYLPASNEDAEALATDLRVAFLSFIGSSKVGWYLRSRLPAGTRCALEHGGAAPVIVDKTACLDTTVERLVKGGYYHAGQVCVSVQRIFLHSAIREAFTERFSRRVKQLKVGDPLLEETEVGPLITPRETERVLSWIQEAVDGGATLLGGGRLSETTLRPAILVEPPATARVSTLEIFGPVTCLYEYRDTEEAIRLANALPVAFQASVFTEDLNLALDCAERIDASTVLINDHTAFRADWMPFSGRKESGYRCGGIPYTMAEMTEDKMIVFNQTV
ncbi:TPA: aldehyde dehydrogenase family protein [Enterobacter hormaechei subsp. steigerwaltii]|nr:aldehyde dehydrogenase family protein [Enterobacter hormaechei subsp. steigerwaltii]